LSFVTFTDSSSIRVALFVLDKIMVLRSGSSSLSKTEKIKNNKNKNKMYSRIASFYHSDKYTGYHTDAQ